MQKMTADLLKERLEQLFAKIKVEEISMADFLIAEKAADGSRDPSCFDFGTIKHEIDRVSGDPTVDVLIIYGLYALYDQKILEKGTIRIFVDTDADVRMGRWIKRDIIEPTKRNPTLKTKQKQMLKHLLNIYLGKSRLEMQKFIIGTKEKADVILPNAGELNGIQLIVDGLDPVIRRRSSAKFGASGWGIRRESILEPSGKSWSSLRKRMASAQQQGPSVSSLGEDNFKDNRQFYDMN